MAVKGSGGGSFTGARTRGEKSKDATLLLIYGIIPGVNFAARVGVNHASDIAVNDEPSVEAEKKG